MGLDYGVVKINGNLCQVQVGPSSLPCLSSHPVFRKGFPILGCVCGGGGMFSEHTAEHWGD